MKRIVVCGSREYENYEEAKAFPEDKIGDIKEGEAVILSGGCRGTASLIKFATKLKKQVLIKKIVKKK